MATNPASETERGGRYRLGIDVGGTFTDLILLDEQSGHLQAGKVLTTPSDASRGVMEGIAQMLSLAAIDADEIRQVIHATTLVGNAVIEHKGCRTALITTQGFRDVLTFGREFRYDIYDSNLTFPVPLVPRRDRIEVAERITAAGDVLTPLTPAEVEACIGTLKKGEYQAVAICLINSYRNDRHEKDLEEAIRRECPEVAVTRSSQIVAQLGEYERTCAAVMNAFVQPLTLAYLSRVVAGLERERLPSNLLCMSSNGGLLTATTAGRFPIRLMESGPVAGALGAAHHGGSHRLPDLLSFDMGGTTAKACVIQSGAPAVTNEFEVARVQRLTKGSGLPVKLPAIDMLEIGAGGGSIADVDHLGLISVGPESAGADPGPVCYGRGGRKPTVTDANLLLGYLNADFFLGGEMKLDAAAAESAIERLGEKAGMDAVRAAWGVHEIVSQNMANALRTHAIEKAVDYRNFALIAFGGAGPVHAHRIASLLNIGTVIFPWAAGVFSAFGMLTAPLRFDAVRTSPRPISALTSEQIATMYREIEGELEDLLNEAGLDRSQITFARSLDIRYIGQGVELEIPVPHSLATPGEIERRFLGAYSDRYGWTLRGAAVEVINWRVTAIGPLPNVMTTVNGHRPSGASLKGNRQVYLPEERRFTDCPVYDRYALVPGEWVAGPALIEERECTAFIGSNASAVVDPSRSIVMRLGGE